ncbi:glucose-6-phosphate isomerase family protein, partial [Muricomes intestini]
GEAIYVPKRYAHRSVNTGREPLIMFFTFGADSGHDYGTIETKGYHKLILEKDGRPAIVDNPHWR